MIAPCWLLRAWCGRKHRQHYGIAPDGWHWVCQVDSFEWEFSAEDVWEAMMQKLPPENAYFLRRLPEAGQSLIRTESLAVPAIQRDLTASC